MPPTDPSLAHLARVRTAVLGRPGRPSEDITKEKNTGLLLWDGCYVMARHLEMLEKVAGSIRGKRCLDVGAGTGLVSLVAALLGADHVVASEIGESFDLLGANIRDNTRRIAALDSSRIDLVDYVWGTELPAPLQQHFDVVFCSEVIYDDQSNPALRGFLETVCSKGTTVIFAYKKRGLDEDNFVDGLRSSATFKIKAIPGAMIDAELRHVINMFKATRL